MMVRPGGALDHNSDAGASDYRACTDDQLLHALEQLHGLACAVTAQMTAIARELVDRGAWRDDGATGPAPWLAWRLGWEQRSAVGFLRVAEQLRDLPAIAGRFAQGALSYDQVRPLVRLATPETDQLLAGEAPRHSPAALARAARAAQLAEESPADCESRRRFQWRQDVRRGELRLWGRLPLDQGLQLAAAIDATAERARREGCVDPDAGAAAIRADALLEACGIHEGSSLRPEAGSRAEVVIVVDPALSIAETEDGSPLHSELARLYACSGPIEQCGVPDPSSLLPPALRTAARRPGNRMMRRLRRRDRGTCRFPGCGRTAHLHAHHVVHWADGGATCEPNLVLLCGMHHRMVHVHGWRIVGDPAGEIRVVLGDGRVIGPRAPVPLAPEVAARFGLPSCPVRSPRPSPPPAPDPG